MNKKKIIILMIVIVIITLVIILQFFKSTSITQSNVDILGETIRNKILDAFKK